MPPRKRAAAAPKDTAPVEETLPPAVVDEDPTVADTPQDTGNSQTEPDDGDAQDNAVSAESKAGDDSDDDTPDPNPADEPDSGEEPCNHCWPAGWPENATSVGCGHGSWNRDL